MNIELNNLSLAFSSSLVLLALLFSYKEDLGLEREIIVSLLRAIIQLFLVGYILNYIFKFESKLATSLILLFMILNASWTSSKRASNIENASIISFISIFLASFITIIVLISSKAISYSPDKIIPIGGMIVSNSMLALSLTFKTMSQNFKNKALEVETKLSLAASIYESSQEIIKNSIKMGMQPTIDSTKTLGIVSLPGMMSGLIIAGLNPIEAVKYQILISFILISTTATTSFIGAYLGYKQFFNHKKQFKI